MDQMTGLKCKHAGSSNGDGLCDCCPKGQYVHTACDKSRSTDCVDCPHESFTEYPNYLNKCVPCSVCHSSSNKRVLKECTAISNRQCTCVTGFYCQDDGCEHCLPVIKCQTGFGVARPATNKSNTECVSCSNGTYNNVIDALTRCQPHTSCEKLGRQTTTAGTANSDAVCGDFKSQCQWIVPTCMMAGLVVTLLIVIIIFIYWRSRRHMSGFSGGHCSLVNPPHPAITSVHFQTECKSQNHESWKEKSTEQHIKALNEVNDCVSFCELETDGDTITMTETDKFCQSDHSNGIGGNYTRPIRYPSEPQEDEWTGT